MLYERFKELYKASRLTAFYVCASRQYRALYECIEELERRLRVLYRAFLGCCTSASRHYEEAIRAFSGAIKAF